MTFDVRDERFRQVISPDAVIEPLVTGLGITEGVVWHARDRCLVFSDLSASVVYRWAAEAGHSVLRKPSNITNGNFVDGQGRIVSCEHATSCVSRFEPGGRHVEVLASRYGGREFNSPNDVVCDGRGRIWFTDPTFGRTNPRVGVLREQQLDFQGVFRIETNGNLTLVADDFEQPNGLCLTPGEDALLVNDTERRHIRRFAVHDDGSVSGGKVFATIDSDDAGKPDGMKVDVLGHIYCTGARGIHVLSPDGVLLGVVTTPVKVRNFCFGGSDFRTLFLALDQMICRVPMNVAGVAPPMSAASAACADSAATRSSPSDRQWGPI